MSVNRWEDINRILDALFDLEEQGEDDVEAALDRLCGGDAELRQEVEAALATEAPTFLDRDAADLADTMIQEVGDRPPAVAEPGAQVGPYRLVREIGRGGMGVVYLAARADGQFQRDVALKLLPHAFESSRRIARFRAEREILASLTHPSIAGLLDGGVTDTGRPFLVMEYVDGVPITDYCATHGCTVETRLRLMQQVCAAVQHAHRRLVVHRDLKPGNILVTETAEGPQVKLLDFGIAKLVGEEDPDWTVPRTRTGERMLTPQYAAPEQVRGEAITTATDVYQLGVLAYELLTGERPFNPADLTLTEMERLILETMPEAPSRRASDRPAVPPSDLTGDLDTIVLKALRKEPDRRFGSAEELAEDIERYMNGKPVRARPATAGYRARKFVQRHRLAVGVASVVAVLLGVFVVVLAQQRNAARLEAEKAEQVSDFLIDLFSASNPNAARGDTITADMLLDRGQERMAALNDQPAVQAQMVYVIGRARLGLGQHDQADSLLRRASTMHASVYGSAGEPTLESRNELANVWLVQGRYAEADSLLRDVLAEARRSGNRRQVAIALNDLGNVAHNRSRYEEAEQFHRDALALRMQLDDGASAGIAASLNNVGRALHSQDELEEAATYYRRADSLNRRFYGPMHSETTLTLRNLGELLSTQEKYEAADSLLREVLRIDRELLGPRHPRIARDLNDLATLAARRQQYEEAETYFREVLSIQQEQLGAAHPYIALTFNNLAFTLEKMGKMDSVLAFKQRAYETAQQSLGPDHVRTALYGHNLATTLHETERFEAAEALYRRAIETLREGLPANHRMQSYPLVELGKLLVETGRPSEAEPYLRDGLTITRAAWSADHPKTSEVEAELGHCLGLQGDIERAEALLERSIDRLRDARGDDHASTRAARRYLDELRARRGEAVPVQDVRDTG